MVVARRREIEALADRADDVLLRAVDSGRDVVYDRESRPGVANLLEILAACTGGNPTELSGVYESYGSLKSAAAEAVVERHFFASSYSLRARSTSLSPKYVKAKQMADEGAFGRIHLVKQSEKHSGPHSDWFWDVEQSGGGEVLEQRAHLAVRQDAAQDVRQPDVGVLITRVFSKH